MLALFRSSASTSFDVLSYGAVGNGKTDDSPIIIPSLSLELCMYDV